MDISRADGSVIIVADVNSSPAEKKLIQLEKTIEETAAKLDSKQKEKTGIEERLNAAKASALAAEEAVSKLRAEIAWLNDREWIAAQGFTPQDYQAKVLDRMAPAAAELKEQETILKAQNDEVRRLSVAYQKVSIDCDSMTGKLARMKGEAGGLVDQIIQEREEARRANSAFGKVEDLVGRIAKRLKSLAKSALIFSVISAALTAMRKQFAATIRGNAEASAAFARLKGALLTFAAPILQDIIPALTWLMNLLSAIVTEIMTIAAILTGRSRKSMEEAAKGLYEEADAISATGAAAKKASRQLASFDEINRLTSDSSGGGGVSAIRPDFDLDANPMLEKLSGLFEKINNVFRTIRAGMDIVIDDLKWSFDSKIVPKSKGTWLTAMTALLGATLGASFGGFTGAVIGLTLGAMIGLYITGFDPEYWKNEMGAKEMWTVVIAGLIGAVLGAAFTGIVGAGVGFSLGAVLGLFLVDFAQEEQGGVPELFRELMVVLCALLGIVIGSKVAPGVGTVVGLSIGLAVGLLLYELDKDPKDRSETFRKIGQGIILGLVAGAFGVALAALGVVSTGAAFVISLSIGLILRLFVSEVDDSAVKGYGSKVSLVNPSFTGNISAHSMPTYRSVPALARGAVIPPNREFLAVLGDQRSGNNYEVPDAKLRQLLREELSALGGGKNEAVLMLDRDVLGRVVYRLNKAEGNRIGVSLTGV